MPSDYVFVPEDARKFSREDGWFRDANGRYVLFRGVNFGPRSKIPPYLPVYPLKNGVFSMRTLRDELKKVDGLLTDLKDLGFNVVRLVVQWKALAPDPTTVASKRYLDAVRTIVQKLFTLGIYSLIDFHQDIASERYGGDGFPDWAIVNPPSPPAVVKPWTGWQTRYGCISWPPALSREVRKTLQSFWKDQTTNCSNVFPAQTMLVETIRATAQAFKNLPGVLGYEPFNEPDPVGIREQEFEENYLGPFYCKVINQIGAVDKGAFVFIEPRVDWTVFKRPSRVETFLPRTFPGNRTVFSFHYYDSCTAFLSDALNRSDNMSGKLAFWLEILEKTLSAAAQRHLIPFLSEYGCDYDGKHAWQASVKANSHSYPRQSRAYTDLSLQVIEKRLLNSTLWSFDLYATEKHNDNWNNEDSSLLDWRRRIRDPDVVARPYPIRSSAQPSLLCFDSFSKHGVVVLKGTPVSNAPTVVYIPDAIQYPKGFEIHYTGGRVAWDGANHLLYWSLQRKQSDHQIIVCPVGNFDKRALPGDSQGLLPQTKKLFRTRANGAAQRERS